ncbi:MAG: SCO family protein [Alphaproteobacteria bacterium]|jgi:protein SCO1/2|nr:SCO family protein [Alphaproteobacteria bacterium]MDP6566104.1 SCO family protein [Alphaproteobacteria bacterium]MDP6811884.1 SCO family protein [Alphaproteobacteria bacterium]
MTGGRIALLAAATVIGVALGLIFNAFLADDGGPVVVTGVPKIGGPFELVDHRGRTVRESDFRGAHLLIFFGYTYCPDVCPTELQKMSAAMDLLGDAGDKVRPILISIDPERDTVAVLADYVANFHPRLIGLTGSVEQVAVAAKAYRAYYAKAPADDEGDYLVDHSSFIYFMGPDGKYLSHFSPTSTPEAMAEKIRSLL